MRNIHFSRQFFPYVIKRCADGTYEVLNRDYCHLGVAEESGPYRPQTETVKLHRMTPAKAKRLSARGDSDVSFIALYHDGCMPWRSDSDLKAYLERLGELAKMGIS